MIQLLFSLLAAEAALVVVLLFRTPARRLALLAVDRSKRGRGPIMARTVAATMLIVLGSSAYSIAKIRRREGEFAQLTPTDQVLASRHLLEASLMGMLSSAPSLSSVGNLACLFWVNSHGLAN
jgi:B-cell receptor-associated protein 31